MRRQDYAQSQWEAWNIKSKGGSPTPSPTPQSYSSAVQGPQPPSAGWRSPSGCRAPEPVGRIHPALFLDTVRCKKVVWGSQTTPAFLSAEPPDTTILTAFYKLFISFAASLTTRLLEWGLKAKCFPKWSSCRSSSDVTACLNSPCLGSWKASVRENET